MISFESMLAIERIMQAGPDVIFIFSGFWSFFWKLTEKIQRGFHVLSIFRCLRIDWFYKVCSDIMCTPPIHIHDWKFLFRKFVSNESLVKVFISSITPWETRRRHRYADNLLAWSRFLSTWIRCAGGRRRARWLTAQSQCENAVESWYLNRCGLPSGPYKLGPRD